MVESNKYLDQFNSLLDTAIGNDGITDLHIQSGQQPLFRVDGDLVADEGGLALSLEWVQGVCKSILNSEQEKRFEIVHGVDLAYEHGGRFFRVNIAKESGAPYITARVIPEGIIKLTDIGFPNTSWENIVNLQRGLVLITGVTGSGKSTTLASLLQEINRRCSKNIITIEDPIEYVHRGIKSSIKQRELYRDVISFSDGVEQAMRQDPNVISVGEVRDAKTLLGVVNAADTGHLVFSTLHTKDAAGTVTRCLDIVSEGEGNYVRGALADNLEYVVCQQLIPKIGGGRVLSMEILRNNLAVKKLIRTGEISQIPSAIQTHTKEGMIQMDACLVKLYEAGKISQESAMNFAMSREGMQRYFEHK